MTVISPNVEVPLAEELRATTARVIRYLAGNEGHDEGALGEGEGETVIVPVFDVEVRPHRYLVTIRLPGFSVEEITVALSSNQVVIYGRHQTFSAASVESKRSLPALTFSKVFRLPNWIDMESCEATLSDGILQVAFLRTSQHGLRYVPIKSVVGEGGA